MNFKSYKEALGKNAAALAKKIKKEGVAVSPHWVDLREVSNIIDSFAQGVEPILEGKYTGHSTFSALLTTKAVGIMLNHSENRMRKEDINKAIEMAKEFGLKTIVCVESAEEGIDISKMEPDALALESKELIGTGISITKKKPDELIKLIKNVEIPVYAGAGISSKEDVEKAINLGCYGVFVSSSIVKSPQPDKKVDEFLSAMRKI